MKKLDGRSALITGAGAGIGFAIATAFASEGAEIWLTDVDGRAAEEAAEAIRLEGGNATPAVLDVTKTESVNNVVGLIGSARGSLEILVNNAGINVRSDFRHMTDDQWEQVLQTNLQGVIRCSRDALKLLQASGHGVIINLSSIMAERHLRQLSAYSTTKGAISSLSRSLAIEYAPFGIRVNYICPGFIETALTERFMKNPMMKKFLLDQTPLQRLATPQDVAKAAVFLASDDAQMITGNGITVDGGMSVGL